MRKKRRSRRRERKWRRNFEEEILGYLSLLLSKIALRIKFFKKYMLDKGGKQTYAMDLCSIWGPNIEKNLYRSGKIK